MSEIKKCPQCGAEIVEGQGFCGDCGTRISTSEGTIGIFSNIENNSIPKDVEVVNPKKKKTGIVIAIIVAVLVFATIGMVAEKYAQQQNSNLSNMTDADKELTEGLKEVEEILASIDDESTDKFELGSVNNDIYENKYLGIRFELDGWLFYDREQLMEATNSSTEYVNGSIDDEAFVELFEKSESFMDLKAFHPNGYTNVNLIVQKTLEDDYKLLSERATINALVSQMPGYYKDMGVDLEVCEALQLDVNGVNKYALYCTYTVSGMTAHTLQLIQIKPEHSATVTIVGESKEECLSIVNSLYFY